MAIGDARLDFEQARARWLSQGIAAYSFDFQDRDDDVVSPHCGRAVIRVRVARGKIFRPVVVRGVRRCAKGTSGESIDVLVPNSMDDLFERMRRWIYEPTTKVDLEVTYDSNYGIPLRWSAAKPEISDSDEGFAVFHFRVRR
jgi:hypothetical protein